MSLSGWRPAVVTGDVRVNRDPTFWPRLTTRTPRSAGSSVISTSTSTSSVSASADSGESSGSTGDVGWKVMVVFSGDSVSRMAPHDEQKFDPMGFLCPQLLQ